MSFSNLKRYPLLDSTSLQAYSAADELVIDYLSDHDLSDKRILIINDSFGAISFKLQQFSPQIITDSFISFKASQSNLTCDLKIDNDLSSIYGTYDYVIICLPKNLSYFEDILMRLQGHISPASLVICPGMIKHISNGHFDCLNKHIGSTTTSLAKKKARLIFSSYEGLHSKNVYPISLKIDGFEKEFCNHSNVFSRQKLDIGSRFFLEHIPKGDFGNILDLGCANGVIGIKAKQQNPRSIIHFYDESQMALKSAKFNYSSHFEDLAYFVWDNCYESGRGDVMDLVLCNPPFHQNHTIGDFIAINMFKDSRRALKKGGKLLVIGNSHLGYQVKLKRIFGNSKIIAQNKKFMIIESIC